MKYHIIEEYPPQKPLSPLAIPEEFGGGEIKGSEELRQFEKRLEAEVNATEDAEKRKSLEAKLGEWRKFQSGPLATKFLAREAKWFAKAQFIMELRCRAAGCTRVRRTPSQKARGRNKEGRRGGDQKFCAQHAGLSNALPKKSYKELGKNLLARLAPELT